MGNYELFDVIVVGSGLAGLCSGIAAAESGAGTVILEKMGVNGGSSSHSVGAFAVCGSPAQRRGGIEDSPELFYNDIIACGENENVPELVKIMVKNSASAFKFLKDRGAAYGERLFDVEAHSVKRCFQVPAGLGDGVIKPLTDYFLSLQNTDLRLKNNVYEIIKDENGGVIGVKVIENYDFGRDNSSKPVKILKARKAVIFASGGFERDAAKTLGLDEDKFGSIPSDTHLGATSEALRVLMDAGAGAYQTEFLRFGATIALNDIAKGMLIDLKTMKRFISETAGRREMMLKIIEIAHGKNWPALIFDKKAVKSMNNHEKIESMAEKGELQEFGTLRELADFFNADINLLKKELTRYNDLVRKRFDDDFGKDFTRHKIYEIDEPPFYVCIVYPKLNYTQGGVKIDSNARVLSPDNKPIERLYAAGQATGGVHGKARLTCCSTLDCAVFGIIAGKNAAKETKNINNSKIMGTF